MALNHGWRTEVRHHIDLAAQEIARPGADTILGGGYVKDAEIIVHVFVDQPATVEYRVEVYPEGYIDKPPTF